MFACRESAVANLDWQTAARIDPLGFHTAPRRLGSAALFSTD